LIAARRLLPFAMNTMRLRRIQTRLLCDRLEPRQLLADFFVSTSGLDTNPGTLALPLRNIQRAADLAQPGDTIFIRAGTYRETVTPPRSGTASNPIVYRPYNTERVVITGADMLSGWTQAPGTEVYFASMNWNYVSDFQSNQVFDDGQMLNLARWPSETNNDLVLNPREATVDSVIQNPSNTNQIIITDAEFTEPAARWIGARVWVNLSRDGYDGQGQTGTVVAISGNQLTLSGIDNRLGNQPWGVGPGTSYYLFEPTRTALINTGGIAAGIDRGEWYLDTTNARLFVRSRDGSAPTGIEAKRRSWAFNLDSRSHTQLHNLELFATSLTTDNLAPNRNASPGGIASASNILIDGLRASYVTHFTDQAGNYQMQWPQKSGLILSGSDITLRNSVLRFSAGPLLSCIGTRAKILNNVFADGNYLVTDAGAVSFGKTFDPGPFLVVSTDHEFGFNRVYNTPGRGVAINALRNSTNNVSDIRARVHHNVIHDVLHRSYDSGAIDTVASDGQYVRIDHNVIYNLRGPSKHAIYMDYSWKYVIDHNVVYEVNQPILINWAPNWWPGNTPATQDIRVFNNTALAPTQAESSIGNAFGAADPGVVVRNNIVTKPVAGGNNWTMSNERVALANTFVNAAGRDYRLSAGATTFIDNGMSVPPFNDPIVGPAPDVGAFEFGTPGWAAGSTILTAGDLAPTNLVASRLVSGAVQLSWTNNTTAARGYIVERSSDLEVWTIVATLPAGVTSQVDSPPVDGTWFYRVRTLDSAPSEVATIALPRSAFQTFEAEFNDIASGVYTEQGPPARIAGFSPGSYFAFNSLDFGSAGASRLILRLAVPDTISARRLEIRLDSPAGPLVGFLSPAGTGSWATFTEQGLNITNATGIRDVYIVGAGSINGICNVDQIRFLPVAPSTPRMTPQTDTGASSTDGITRNIAPSFVGLAASGATIRLLRGTTVLTTTVAINGRYTLATTGLVDGTFSVFVDAVGGGVSGTTTSGSTSVTIDTAAPSVSSSSYDANSAPNLVRAEFGEPVSLIGSWVVVDRNTGATLPASATTLAGTTARADVGLPPEGRYRARLTAGALADLAGNESPSVVVDFNVLAGDINGDGAVNFADLLIVAQHYDAGTASYRQGDLNRDGSVSFADLLILAQNYDRQLPLAVLSPLQSRPSRRRLRVSDP
jgi:hypothetical protein